MKLILKMLVLSGLILAFSNSRTAFASSSIKPSALELPAGFLAMKTSEFIKITAKDFSLVTGKKLNLKDRIAFSVLKNKMKRSLKSHPDQTVKDYLASADKKDNTTLIIILVILVVVVAAVIISSVNSIDIGGGLAG